MIVPDMVRGQRTAATGGDRLDEALTVKGEKGVFGKQHDEGHFYFLDDFLSIHCPGQKFGTLRERSKHRTKRSIRTNLVAMV